MTGLAAYERAVVASLRDGRTLGGADVVRWAVHRWAATSLAQVCPLTAAVLDRAGRWRDEVDAQLSLGDRPAVLHAWGGQLLARLRDDPDPLVAAVARLEHGALRDAVGLTRAGAPAG